MSLIEPNSALATFYITGGTLPPHSASYIERRADTELTQALQRGELCYVLNARQMGKSSLSVRARQALEVQGAKTAFLDLQKFGSSATAEQWYRAILERMGHDLKLRPLFLAYWRDNSELPPLERLFGALRDIALEQIPGPLIVFFDEIDVVGDLSFKTDEFFGAIRQCHNARAEDEEFRRLTFCLLGTVAPTDLIRDVRLSPFNIGTRIRLTDFTPAEAAPLAEPLPGGNRTLERVLWWTNGHPYLTQRLCAELTKSDSTAVDDMVARLFFSKSDADVDENIKNVRNAILRMGGEGTGFDQMALLTRYGQIVGGKRVPDDNADGVCAALRLSGLVTSRDGLLQSRNRVYARLFDAAWVRDNLPNAELRRQKAAVARARWQIGMIAAGVLLLMGTLTAFALTSRSAALLAKAEAERERTKAVTAARAEKTATLAADQERTKAQQQAQSALMARNQAQVALKGESAAKARALQNALLARQSATQAQQSAQQAKRSAIIADGEKARAQAQTRLAEGYSDKAQRLIYNSDTNLAQRAMENSLYALAQSYLDDMGRLLKRNPHLEAGYEWIYLNEQMHRERREIKAKTGPIWSVALSPDGKTLATAGQNGAAGLWDMATGKEVRKLQGAKKNLYQISVSPDGTQIAAGGQGEVLYFWDANTGRKIFQIDHVGYILAIAFSPSGKQIVTGSADDRPVSVWDTLTGKKMLQLEQKGNSSAVSFSPDGKEIASVGFNTVYIWDAATGKSKQQLQENNFSPHLLAFSPDGKRIATGDDDNTLRIWDAKTGTKLLQLKRQDGYIQSVAFSPDGNRLLTGCGDGSARVWDSTSGQEMIQFGGHTKGITSALFTPDGQIIVTGSEDGTIRLWNIVEMANAGIKEAIPVTSLALSPDGGKFITGNNDGSAHLFDVAMGKELWYFKSIYNPGTVKVGYESVESATSYSRSCSVAFSPDGKKVLVGSGIDRVARLYDVARHKEIGQLKGHESYVREVAFSPDGKLMATGGGNMDGSIIVWEATTRQPLWKLRGHSGEVDVLTLEGIYALAFTPDSKRLLTATKYDAPVWDMATGRKLFALKEKNASILSAAFSPDGKRIVTGDSSGTASIWDATTGKKRLQLQGHKAQISAITFSSDNKRIATASGDGSARLWDAATGNELLHFITPSAPAGTSDAVYAVAFSPDGKQLFTGHGDGSVHIWRKMTDVQIAMAAKLQGETAARLQENKAIEQLPDAPIETILQTAQALLSKRPNDTLRIASGLNGAAWKVVDPTKPVPTQEKAKMARQVAEKAVALTGDRDGLILDTLAAAQFACGDLEGAIQNERKAVQVYQSAPDSSTKAATLAEMRAQLAKYEKLLSEKLKGKR